ncbi:MAG: phosphoserine phosphatase SerB [Candidatus Hydrogenedentes bacterium]|nr:phosphoserine phosphatase SerB [Candidatus Hydrogenedentota bacterium]
MREILLISVRGEDRPGVTSSLTRILAEHDATVLDIGQAVIHEGLNLGMMVEVPATDHSSALLKELLFCAHELDMKIKFTPISEQQYAHWVEQQGKERYIITILGLRLTARHIAGVSSVLAAHGLNIDIIHRLSGRIPLEPGKKVPYACVEMSVRGTPPDGTALRQAFLLLSHEQGIDIAFQKDDLYRRNRRVIAFDMDSTLIQTEVIDELAEAAGKRAAVSAITEAAMRGELDFQQSLRKRLSLLKGLDAGTLAGIAERLPLTDGVEHLFQTLKTLGYKTAIISGGFTYFGEFLQKKLGVDYVFANELEIVDGKLTGNVVGEIVDGPKKAACLRAIAEQEHISLQQVIAVGDGANDLPMLREAGLGIAFQAKPLVKQSAEQSLSSVGLDGILYLLGLRDRDTGRAM